MINIETRSLFTMTMKSERQVSGRTPLGERRVVIVPEATIDGPGLRATSRGGSSPAGGWRGDPDTIHA